MSSSSPPHVVEECFGILRILSDGSIVRSPDILLPVPVRDEGTVQWRDIQFNPTHDLHLRLYKPLVPHKNNADEPSKKLPVLFYFHGGGFCLVSRTWPSIHNCCLRLAADLPALVLAPDYRLAPEHRLPAAIDDGSSAVDWLFAQSMSVDPDPWIADAADFGRVFISGDSAGGNIAHHLAVRFGPSDLSPVRIRGHVLVGPFFGGAERTRSEIDSPDDGSLTLATSEQCWRLSLPVGAGMDHPVANPVGPESGSLEAVPVEPMLVVIAGRDMLRDRQVEYARRMKEWGKTVEIVEIDGQPHGFFVLDPWSERADELVRVIRRFMAKN